MSNDGTPAEVPAEVPAEAPTTKEHAPSIGTEVAGGVKEALPVAAGLIPLGLAFGLVVVQAGLSWWWAPLFSVIIFAGSMEYLAVGLIMAHTGLIGSAVTAFMVNFRHIFYGLTFPRDVITSRLGRAYSTYALIDEAYAIISSRRPSAPKLTGPRLLAIQVFCQYMWVLPATIGALAGAALPEGIKGAEFALVALFAVLALDAFEVNKDWSLPFFAVVCTLIGGAIWPSQMLVLGLVLYFLLLLLRSFNPRVDEALTWCSTHVEDTAGTGGEKRA